MSSLACRPGGMWSMLAWLVAGSVIAFFGMSLMTVGLPVLAIAIVAAALRNWKWDLPGLLAGVSLPVLWVAWKNRGGPGNECITTPSASGCGELLDPMPWMVVGVAVLAFAAATWMHGRRHRPAQRTVS